MLAGEPLASPTVIDPPQTQHTTAPWSLAACIAFRFCFVCFGLYCLSSQIITALIAIPIIDLPDPSSIPPWRQIITFTAIRISHHKDPLVFTGSGSGDTPAFYSATIDTKKNTLALTQRRAANVKLNFTFARPAPNQLILDGLIDGHPTHIQLRLDDPHKFLLVSRGFHWVQEYPLNR